jgi:hypothetical protein
VKVIEDHVVPVRPRDLPAEAARFERRLAALELLERGFAERVADASVAARREVYARAVALIPWALPTAVMAMFASPSSRP